MAIFKKSLFYTFITRYDDSYIKFEFSDIRILVDRNFLIFNLVCIMYILSNAPSEKGSPIVKNRAEDVSWCGRRKLTASTDGKRIHNNSLWMVQQLWTHILNKHSGFQKVSVISGGIQISFRQYLILIDELLTWAGFMSIGWLNNYLNKVSNVIIWLLLQITAPRSRLYLLLPKM